MKFNKDNTLLRQFLYFVSIFLILLQFSFSQSINLYPYIPYAVSSVSMNDYLHNPAKTIYNQRNNVALSYTPSIFGLQQLNQNSIAVTYGDTNIVHLAYVNGSFSNLFTYSNIGYSFVYKLLNNFTPSISVNYSYLRIKDNNDYGNLTFDFGGILVLDKNLKFGFSLKNFFRNSFESNPDIARQSALFGAEFSFTDDFKAHIGTEIRLESSSGIIIGFIKDFDDLIKCGISYITEPEMIEANLSVKSINNLRIIYNINYHNQLGATHQFGLEYNLE